MIYLMWFILKVMEIKDSEVPSIMLKCGLLSTIQSQRTRIIMDILPRVHVMQSLYSEKENDLFDELEY